MKRLSFSIKCFVIGAATAVGFQAPAGAQEAPNVQAERLDEGLVPLVFVGSEGQFIRKFVDLNTALERSRGDGVNRTMRNGVELVYLNSRCDPANRGAYSMTSLVRAGIDQPYQAYQDWRTANPGRGLSDPERKARERAMVDEINSKLAATFFPRYRDCDPVPIMLSIGLYDMLHLEQDDAGNPLVGTKINDGLLYSVLSENNPLAEAFKQQNKNVDFAQKFAMNRFSSAQDAVNAAFMFRGNDSLVIFDGKSASLYRLGRFEVNRSLSGAAFDAQFDALKAAKLRDGLTILAVVLGEGKAVRINTPGR